MKRSFSARGGLTAAFIALATVIPGNSSAATAIVNGDFAKGRTGWWGEGKWDVVDKTLQVQNGFACQDKIEVDGGQRYRIRFEAKGSGGYVQLSYRGGGIKGGWYGPASATQEWGQEKALAVCDEAADWKAHSVVVQAPAKADQMLLYLRRLPGKKEGMAQYRNVRLEPTEEAVTRPAGFAFAQIRNPDFSKGKAPWWGEGQWDVENGELKITGGFACQDGIAVEPGKRYKLSMRIKSAGAPAGSVFVQASYRGEGVSQGWVGAETVKQSWGGERALFVTGGTQDWETGSCVNAPPADAETLLVYLRKKAKTEGVACYVTTATKKVEALYVDRFIFVRVK